MDDRITRLQRISLFRQIDEGSLEVFANHLVVHDLADGEAVFKEGDPGDALFVIDSGQVVVSKIIDWDDMREKTLAILPAGAFFGEGALMENVPRSATVRARGPARLFKLTRDVFFNLVQTSPLSIAKLLFSMTKIVNARLRQTSHELVTLYDTGRIAGEGLSLAELLDQILERITESTGAQKGVIFLMNPYTQTLEVGLATGLDPLPPFDLGAGLFARVLGEGKTLMTPDFSSTGLTPLGFEPRSLLAVPMILGDDPVGMLLLGDRDNGLAFNAGQLHLLQGVASQVATAVVNAYKRAEEEAAEAHQRHYVRF